MRKRREGRGWDGEAEGEERNSYAFRGTGHKPAGSSPLHQRRGVPTRCHTSNRRFIVGGRGHSTKYASSASEARLRLLTLTWKPYTPPPALPILLFWARGVLRLDRARHDPWAIRIASLIAAVGELTSRPLTCIRRTVLESCDRFGPATPLEDGNQRGNGLATALPASSGSPCRAHRRRVANLEAAAPQLMLYR